MEALQTPVLSEVKTKFSWVKIRYVREPAVYQALMRSHRQAGNRLNERHFCITGPLGSNKSLLVAALCYRQMQADPSLRTIIVVNDYCTNLYRNAAISVEKSTGVTSEWLWCPRNDLTCLDKGNEYLMHELFRFMDNLDTVPINSKIALCTHGVIKQLLNSVRDDGRSLKNLILCFDLSNPNVLPNNPALNTVRRSIEAFVSAPPSANLRLGLVRNSFSRIRDIEDVDNTYALSNVEKYHIPYRSLIPESGLKFTTLIGHHFEREVNGSGDLICLKQGSPELMFNQMVEILSVYRESLAGYHMTSSLGTITFLDDNNNKFILYENVSGNNPVPKHVDVVITATRLDVLDTLWAGCSRIVTFDRLTTLGVIRASAILLAAGHTKTSMELVQMLDCGDSLAENLHMVKIVDTALPTIATETVTNSQLQPGTTAVTSCTNTLRSAFSMRITQLEVAQLVAQSVVKAEIIKTEPKNRLERKVWNAPSKCEARTNVIIDPYQKLFGSSLPADKMYLTLAGNCTTAGSQPLSGSEPEQLIASGLIQPEQFHGIDDNSEIINRNAAAYPKCDWHYGAMHTVIEQMHARENYNPGIIHVDTMVMAENAANLAGRIMAFTADVGIDDVMLVLNYVIRQRTINHSPQHTLDLIMANPQVRYSIELGWKLMDWPLYIYDSRSIKTEKGNIQMASLIFMRRK